LEKELEKYFNKGVCALDDGNWILAVRHFKKCLEIDKGYIPAYLELADIYYHNGQFEAAAEEIRCALNLDHKDSEANFALGNIYVSLGRHKDALRIFKKMEADAPEFAPELYYNIGMAYKALGYPELALDYLKLALEDDPSYFECLEPIGKIHMDAGRLDEAKKVFLEYMEVDPGNINVHHMLGLLYSKQLMWKAAIEEWEKVLALAPNTDEAKLAKKFLSDAQALKRSKEGQGKD
jgi:tetratricopeptide (TPR) repeat protein